MEAYFIPVISFLFILAISLLIVGVSNDAVNFLNSAIGSKAASFKTILAVASAGVLIGAVFSNGMMEVARKGIFNPEHFSLNEIMVVFLAVMLTNLLLLDFFNTLGLPTSTTVSIVFGILGSALAVAVYKIAGADIGYENVVNYINVEGSFLIILGIFASVIIAFSAGAIVQWIVRMGFSFNIKKSSRFLSGIWGGFSITFILYFLFIKGASGSILVSPEFLNFIKENTRLILLISFFTWTLLFQFLILVTRINVLKITVLSGTFALAMAFAGNDLVNFIGVPLAGYESLRAFFAAGASDPSAFLMTALLDPVDTPVYFLVLSGLIMVLTLRFSKKARSVTATTINLSRQGEGSERFASTALARFMVRRSIEISRAITRFTPAALSRIIDKRFDPDITRDDKQDKLAFDMVRASVNLVVASILIAYGTSLRLPLSTTYVTFMVAMGTSLSDGAWGRDSAVYRVTGVLTVIGGWFFTALSAFILAFTIATIIYFWKVPAILILVALSIYILVRTYVFHKKKSEQEEKKQAEILPPSHEILRSCDEDVRKFIQKTSKILSQTYNNFLKEKHNELKRLKKETKDLGKDIKEMRENIPETLRKLSETDALSGHHFVQVVAYLKEMSNSLTHIVQPAFYHLDNNHAFDKENVEKIRELNNQLADFFNFVLKLMKNKNYAQMDEMTSLRDQLINKTNEILLNRIRILKKNQKGVKISMTYIEMLSETKNLLLNIVHLVKSEARLIETFLGNQEKLVEEIMD